MNLSLAPAHSKFAVLGSLYFSQGLPFGFFTQALPVVLRKEGMELGSIGLASLLAAPWALKFMWAPLVDRYRTGSLGPRKSWIVPLQVAAVVTLIVLAHSIEFTSLELLMAGVFLLNLIAATQDIATDGLAVDSLRPSERGIGNGVQVAGYRVGMIVGGGALLVLHDELGRASVFLVMAGLIAVATLPLFAVREATRPSQSPARGASILNFLRRPGSGRILIVLCCYKAGDALASGMLRPFLVDQGLGLTELGWLLGTFGFVAGLAGALVGGTLIGMLGRRRALLVFGLLQAVSVAGYAILASGALSTSSLYTLCAFEHFSGGMATAALFTCMMDWCSADESATDYTVQASMVVIATGTLSALSGFSAQLLGYLGHFCVSAVLAVLGVAAVARWFPWGHARLSDGLASEGVEPCA